MATDDAKDRMRAVRAHGSPLRRRPGEGNISDAGDAGVEPKTRITVDLPQSLHQALRVRVAMDPAVPDGQSLVRALLTEELAEELARIQGRQTT